MKTDYAEGKGNAASAVRCHAHNRRGGQCGNMAAPGKRVCHVHGGAPGSGAPKGNQNRRIHGLDSRRFRHGNGQRRKGAAAGAVREPQGTAGADSPGVIERAQELLKVEGLREEIAIYRVLIRDAVRAERDLTTIGRGMDVLARLERARYAVSPAREESRAAALAETLERLGEQFGLRDFAPLELGEPGSTTGEG